MVLVDTSVWIRYFARRDPFLTGMRKLLAADQVVGHELVYGELLIGDHGGRREFLETYELYHRSVVVPHREIVALVRQRQLNGVAWAGSTFIY